MQPINADRIFLWARSETHYSQIEFCQSYCPSSFSRLHHDASEFIFSQLDEFYREFCDWIHLADFPDVEEQISPSELLILPTVFSLASSEDLSKNRSSDCFSALCAVIRHRLNQQSLEGLIQAAHLFNYTIEYSVFGCDTNPWSILIIGSADVVAPAFLDHLSNSLDSTSKADDSEDQVVKHKPQWGLIPAPSILQILARTVESESLLNNDASLQLFNLVFNSYQAFLQPPLKSSYGDAGR